MSDTDITRAMLTFINTWAAKPVKIELELTDKAPLSMAMQQLSGTVIEKKYIDGTFVGMWPFAVYVHINGRDTAQRLLATQTLDTFGKWIQSAELPSIGANRQATSIEMTALPSLAARYENGYEDYQAVFGLKYKQRSA